MRLTQYSCSSFSDLCSSCCCLRMHSGILHSDQKNSCSRVERRRLPLSQCHCHHIHSYTSNTHTHTHTFRRHFPLSCSRYFTYYSYYSSPATLFYTWWAALTSSSSSRTARGAERERETMNGDTALCCRRTIVSHYEGLRKGNMVKESDGEMEKKKSS